MCKSIYIVTKIVGVLFVALSALDFVSVMSYKISLVLGQNFDYPYGDEATRKGTCKHIKYIT